MSLIIPFLFTFFLLFLSLSLSPLRSVFRRSVFIRYIELSTPVLFSPLLIRETLCAFVRLCTYFEHNSGFYLCLDSFNFIRKQRLGLCVVHCRMISLKVGPIDYSQISVNNHQSTVRNIPGECRKPEMT